MDNKRINIVTWKLCDSPHSWCVEDL